MASGIRSIVWRSDIDAGRERPAFFLWRKGGADPAGGTAGGTACETQLTQLIPAFLGMDSEKGRERKREREEGEGWGGEEVICLTNKNK